VAGECDANDGRMTLEDGFPFVGAEGPDSVARAFDVGEKHGDGPRWCFGAGRLHGRILISLAVTGSAVRNRDTRGRELERERYAAGPDLVGPMD
jgi:hypothetical protein